MSRHRFSPSSGFLISVTLLLASFTLSAQLPSRVFPATAVVTVSSEQLNIAALEGAALTSAGDIVIGDPNDLVVVIVSPKGVIRRVGRSGEGPGEFRNIRAISFSGGLIWVTDNRQARLSGFTPEGRVAQTIRLDMFGALPDGTKVIVWPIAVVNPKLLLLSAGITSPTRVNLPEGTMGMILQAPDRSNTQELAWVPGGNSCLQSGGGRMSFVRPFCAAPVVTAAPNGKGTLVVVGAGESKESSSFVATVRNLSTGAETKTRVSYLPKPLLKAHWDSVVNRFTAASERVPQFAGVLDDIPQPARFPAFGSGVLLDDLVALVQVFVDDSPHTHWVVIKEGRTIGRLELAVGERPLVGTGESLWVSTLDEDGLFGVRLYRLRLNPT